MQILVPANVASMAFLRGLVCTPWLPLEDCNYWFKMLHSLNEDASVHFTKTPRQSLRQASWPQVLNMLSLSKEGKGRRLSQVGLS
jgi:hypothetical protein